MDTMRTSILIHEAKKQQGITNTEIASALGLTEWRVRKIVSCIRKYDSLSKDVKGVGDVLGIDPDVLDEARMLDKLDSIEQKRKTWNASLDRRAAAVKQELEKISKRVES